MRWPHVVSAESCRHAAHLAYRRGRFHARLSGRWTSAHRLGLLAALSSRYLQRGDLRPTDILWAELAPFLLVETDADGLTALTEYLVFQEDPDHADIETLGLLLNEAVRPLDARDAEVLRLLRCALASHTFDWLAVFSYHNLRLLRHMVELDGADSGQQAVAGGGQAAGTQ
jgi:hypothetical protein